MILIIFIILLNSFIMMLRGFKPSALYCGLWCYVGDGPVDPWKLKILALYNQSRGDHATGMCIDNVVFKQLGTAAEFLVEHNELFKIDQFAYSNFAILGHCRQATAMYAKDNMEFAHPHEIKRNATDEQSFLFGVHNGTITNTYDLTDKYGLDMNTTKYSDSMQLFSMITKSWDGKNMDVLKEYEGSATVVFYPRNAKNTLYVHRDKARELFYWQESETSCYISSIKNSLYAIGGTEQTVFEFPQGILYKFHNGKKITEWDLTAKMPYSRPRTTHYANTAPRKVYNATPIKPTIVVKTGLYWSDHLYFWNGHVFTGEIFVSKETGKAERYVIKSEQDKYDMYYAVMGLAMKSKDAFEKLYNRCSSNNEFKPELFKKLGDSNLQEYALYPIRGKLYTASPSQFFWYDKLKDINIGETYTWIPVLSNTEFSIDRAGGLKSSQELKPEQTIVELIVEVIEEAVELDNPFQTIAQLFGLINSRLYKKPSGTLQFELFLEHFLDAAKAFNYASQSNLNRLHDSLTIEEFYGSYHKGDARLFAENILKETQEAIKDLRKEDVEEVAFEDMGKKLEELENTVVPESAFFRSQGFKDSILFGTHDTLDDIKRDHLISDEKAYAMALYGALAELFHELGLMTNSELSDVKKLDPRSAELRVSKVYENLRDESYFKSIFQKFEGTDTDINKGFSELYRRYMHLDIMQKRGTREESELSCTKFALKFLASKNIDKSVLVNKYNVTNEQIEEVCR